MKQAENREGQEKKKKRKASRIERKQAINWDRLERKRRKNAGPEIQWRRR